MRRLLVTGSRSWEDVETTRRVLLQFYTWLGGSVVLVHGGANGADKTCSAIWTSAGLPEEVHRPIWYPGGVYDWRAGFTRNNKMVARGADHALAFDLPCMKPRCTRPIGHVTHGTADAIERITAAGIPLWRWSQSMQ